MELKRIAREMRKEQRAKELMERRFLEEVEKQQRFEELELMREEDRLSRRWAKQLNREAKHMEREEKLAAKVKLEEDMWTKRMEMRRGASEWYEVETRRVNREAERKEEEALSRELYPVRQVNLPFKNNTWPQARIFPMGSLSRVTPPILERLRRVQKGEEQLRFDNNYYDTPNPTDPKPGTLLLFVQYPKGPYIYCGRLGYLGFRSNPLEFSFQLLDINALNWGQLRQAPSARGGEPADAGFTGPAHHVSPLTTSQAAKPAVKLEATRRSSRQQKRRVIAEQQARERQLEEQRQLERQVAVKKAREVQIALKRQQIELERQQQKLRREQQKEEEKRKTQKIKYQKEEERRHVRIRQLKQIEADRFREWRQQMKEQESQRRRELERQNEPPPEIVAQRNAEVQKFIQEELDKQARLAKEKKEREMQLQALVTQRETERVKQEEQYRQLETTEIQAVNKPVITADQVVAVGALELPIEFELRCFTSLYRAMSVNISTKTLPSGAEIPVIGLGVYKAEPGAEDYTAVLSALKLGYRHIDTAQFYQNEADASTATKASNEQLGLGYIDLYLLRTPGPAVTRDETWRALEDLQQKGILKDIGVSNFGEAHLQKFLKAAKVKPAVNQLELHPWLMRASLVKFCKEHDIL
ncbi:NADP-dependent oxidoreductase domain [Phytophthora cactorum]|nr:NADP-dependent oxidoreductase domain [Phytophthora cactorum]